MVGARVRREQVAFVQTGGLSRRRACAVVSVARSTVGYQSRLVAKDAPVLTAMRELAGQDPRYGYRRIQIFLKRAGHVMSADRTHRLWRQAGLQVPRRRPRRRAATSRPRPLPSQAANHVWAYDFVFDACANGQTLKCLTIIDEWTRECLAIDVAGGIRSTRVIEVLTQLVSVHGAPQYIRSDNASSWPARFSDGSTPRRSRRPSLIRANRGRMAPTNRSMGSSATSTSACSGFAIASRPA